MKVVHAIAECLTCGWHNYNYKNAQATGAIHARKHKHKVSLWSIPFLAEKLYP